MAKEQETEYFTLRGTLIQETEKAVHVRYDDRKKGGRGAVWLPRSRCEVESYDGLEKPIVVKVPDWLVDKNNLEDYVE